MMLDQSEQKSEERTAEWQTMMCDEANADEQVVLTDFAGAGAAACKEVVSDGCSLLEAVDSLDFETCRYNSVAAVEAEYKTVFFPESVFENC